MKIYQVKFEYGDKKKIMIYTIAANCFSCALGFIRFGFIGIV